MLPDFFTQVKTMKRALSVSMAQWSKVSENSHVFLENFNPFMAGLVEWRIHLESLLQRHLKQG